MSLSRAARAPTFDCKSNCSDIFVSWSSIWRRDSLMLSGWCESAAGCLAAGRPTLSWQSAKERVSKRQEVKMREASHSFSSAWGLQVRRTPAFSSGPGGAPLARHRAQPRLPLRPGKGRDARIRLLQRVVRRLHGLAQSVTHSICRKSSRPSGSIYTCPVSAPPSSLTWNGHLSTRATNASE